MKIKLFILFTISLLTFNLFAQTEPDAQQTIEAQEIKVTVNYILSTISLSSNYLGSGSILTWRDLYFNGVQANVEFGKNLIGVGYSGSFHGYHTDDDASNNELVMSVADTKSKIFSLFYERQTKENWLIPKIGMDFNLITIKNYDSRSSLDHFEPYPFTEGLINTYDIYKFGFFGINQVSYNGKHFYFEAEGHAGIGLYFIIADWILRTEFRHPVSFLDTGITFRAGASVEAGFKTGKAVFFIRPQITYEISPGLTIDTQFHEPDGIGMQPMFFEFSSASVSLGIKMSF